LWIAWLSRAEKSLEREEGSLDGQGGGPLVFEDVETDCAGLRRDIGVPNYRRVRVNGETERHKGERTERYSERQRQRETGTETDRESSTFRDEAHLWRAEGIVGWDYDIDFEDSSRVGSVCWTIENLQDGVSELKSCRQTPVK
jgi:hypothetical protein